MPTSEVLTVGFLPWLQYWVMVMMEYPALFFPQKIWLEIFWKSISVCFCDLLYVFHTP